MLGETSDGEFKLLRISKLDNDDMDGKPDSTVEDTQGSILGKISGNPDGLPR